MNTLPESVINFPGGVEFYALVDIVPGMTEKDVRDFIVANAKHVTTTYTMDDKKRRFTFHDGNGAPLEIEYKGESYEVSAYLQYPDRGEAAIYDLMDVRNLVGYNAEFDTAGFYLCINIENFPQDTDWF